MSTNFYFKKHPEGSCLHIGKSSMGWTFALRGYENLNINSLKDWENFLQSSEGEIIDEYNQRISFSELMRTITKRSWRGRNGEVPSRCASWEEFHEKNQSMEGPNGLFRTDPAKMGPRKIVIPKDPKATYDICFYEFS